LIWRRTTPKLGLAIVEEAAPTIIEEAATATKPAFVFLSQNYTLAFPKFAVFTSFFSQFSCASCDLQTIHN